MASTPFRLGTDMRPLGDQPAAIDSLVTGIERGEKHQTLLGVTGSGKTFTMANVIQQCQRPALVISHNKTLAAQLYEEFKELFPDNAVHYFVSYYDYYQPEAYIPQRDIYIEKDSSRNDDLDRLRLAATTALVSRRDVIVVASVSCIFGLGSPDAYRASVISLTRGQTIRRQDFLRSLTDMQYKRAEFEFKRGTFRVRGDVIELFSAGDEVATRIELFGDTIDALQIIDPVSGELLRQESQLFIYPAVHYVVPEQQIERAVASIKEELDARVLELRSQGKLLEAQRLLARTKYDLELIQEVGFCQGIENYSRHLDGRPAGAKPYTLLDYFPDATRGLYSGAYADGSRTDAPLVPPEERNQPVTGDDAPTQDWLVFIDESHVTLPQIRAMYHGDRSRKQVLVDHGFRLPSAMDNRPLRFEEVEKVWPQVIFVSATPGPYELQQSGGAVVEQIIRPTGLVDPPIEIRPASGQVPDLLKLAQERSAKGERTIVTTLTKRLSEDLASYLSAQGLKCRYMHSEIETLDRVEILKDLRVGEYDVLVGVNLLREGLDLPEVSLVAIMDADKAGFLRSPTSLIQQIGRAARNLNGSVILYADAVTPAMAQAMQESSRRRVKQLAFNQEHGITPFTVQKAIRHGIELELKANRTQRAALRAEPKEFERAEIIADLEKQMLEAAQNLDFEKAAQLRDRVKQIKDTPDIGGKIRIDDGDEEDDNKPKPGTPGTRPSKKRRPKRSV